MLSNFWWTCVHTAVKYRDPFATIPLDGSQVLAACLLHKWIIEHVVVSHAALDQGLITAQSTTSETSSAEQSKYTGPEPRRYAIAEGQWAAVLTAAATSLLRFGSGAFAKGYTTDEMHQVGTAFWKPCCTTIGL